METDLKLARGARAIVALISETGRLRISIQVRSAQHVVAIRPIPASPTMKSSRLLSVLLTGYITALAQRQNAGEL